jgi:class 3 adenylate cyclase
VFHRADHNGAALAYFYDENEPGRRTAAELLRAKSSAIKRFMGDGVLVYFGSRRDNVAAIARLIGAVRAISETVQGL